MDITSYKTDSTKEETGVWLEFDEARFLIKSSKTKSYQRKFLQTIRAIRQAEARKNPLLIRNATVDLIFKECLVGWEGVKEGETDLPFNKVNVEKLKAFPDFVDFVMTAADDIANFQAEDMQEETESFRDAPDVDATARGA